MTTSLNKASAAIFLSNHNVGTNLQYLLRRLLVLKLWCLDLPVILTYMIGMIAHLCCLILSVQHEVQALKIRPLLLEQYLGCRSSSMAVAQATSLCD